MSHHPGNTLAGLCFAGGVAGYARTRSIPSLVAGLGFGSLYLLSSMRIKEGMSYGYEGAALTSGLLLAAMLPRAIKTRRPIPIGLALVATAGGVYYGKAVMDFRA